MENLSREAILRMLSGKTGNSSSSGGGGDIDLAGYATSIWVTENFVSIDFFRELFRAFDSSSNEILPNDTTSVVASIKAMVGTWTEQYLTALGNAGGGGGGGGGAQYLNDLLDVELTTPLTDGQALVYNATLQKWVNGAAGVNMTTVWNALAGSTNEQINASHLSTALSGYVTTSAISDMATQTWVGQQGFATQTWVTSNFITIAYFDRLFRAYNGSTLVSHNDTTTTIDNIKSMFGFWTEFYLSALGTGGVSSVSISLSQLADVNVAGVTNGQVLSYNSTNAEWVPTTISNVTSLSALTDVALSSPTTYQVLMYDASTTKWYNSALKTINGQPLYGSGDISVGGGASGNYLPLTGGTLTGQLIIHNPTFYNVYDSDYPSAGSITSTKVCSYFISPTYSSNQYGLHIWGTAADGNTHLQCGDAYGGTGSYNIIFQELGGNIGIGTRSPSSKLHVYGDVTCKVSFFYGIDGNTNVGYIGRGSNGNDGMYFESYSNNIYLLASSIGVGTTSPSCKFDINGVCKSLYMLFYATDGSSNAGYVGRGSNNNNDIIVESYSDLRLYASHVGIGTNFPNYKLHVDGDIYATGAVTALSDIRHKTIIKDTAVSVEDISRMPAVMYQWNDGREDKELHVGSIAQNWQTVLPEVVLKANDEEGTLSMQYGVAALVSSIIIARKVVNHEERIKQLEKENKELKKRLNIA